MLAAGRERDLCDLLDAYVDAFQEATALAPCLLEEGLVERFARYDAQRDRAIFVLHDLKLANRRGQRGEDDVEDQAADRGALRVSESVRRTPFDSGEAIWVEITVKEYREKE